MIFSIISEYDIFFNGDPPEFSEQQCESGLMTYVRQDGKLCPRSFFSTDPAAYLKKENQITPFYQ